MTKDRSLKKEKKRGKTIHCGQLIAFRTPSQPENVRWESFLTKAIAYFKLLSMHQRESLLMPQYNVLAVILTLSCYGRVLEKQRLSLTHLYNRDSSLRRAFFIP